MPDQAEIEKRFWKAIKSDRTIMLGLADRSGGGSQPMTAIVEEAERGPLWIFSAKDVELVEGLGAAGDAVAQFVARDHGLFAAMHGRLSRCDDPAVIDRLWNPFVAAWYDDGRDDPKLQLLRFDLDHVHVWLNERGIFAGVKMLLGRDPKKEYAGKTADVAL